MVGPAQANDYSAPHPCRARGDARGGRHTLDDPASIPDQERLQRALDGAIERRNVALFTRSGKLAALG